MYIAQMFCIQTREGFKAVNLPDRPWLHVTTLVRSYSMYLVTYEHVGLLELLSAEFYGKISILCITTRTLSKKVGNEENVKNALIPIGTTS